GSGLHIQVLAHFPNQPFGRWQVAPEGRWLEPRALRTIHKVRPAGRQQTAAPATAFHERHLPKNLVRRQKIIGVEPLDVVALTEGKCLVTSPRRAFVVLPHNENLSRLELTRYCQRVVLGAVVDDDNLFSWPRLR